MLIKKTAAPQKEKQKRKKYKSYLHIRNLVKVLFKIILKTKEVVNIIL